MATPTSFTPKLLAAGVQVPAADTLIYTSPAGLGTRVQAIILVNTTATPVTINVTHGLMAVANALCWQFSVPADGLPYNILSGCPQGIIMDTGNVLRAQAGAGASITLISYGVEMA